MKKANKELLKSISRYLITYNIKVFVDLSGKRRLGEVIGTNQNTTWVRIRTGAKTYMTIKRHNKKHNMKLYRMEDIINEDVYTKTGN